MTLIAIRGNLFITIIILGFICCLQFSETTAQVQVQSVPNSSLETDRKVPNLIDVAASSNVSKMESTLKNIGSKDSGSKSDVIMPALIGLAGGIGGATVGFFSNYFVTTRVEKKKHEEECRKHKEFVSATREVIFNELKDFSFILHGLRKYDSIVWKEFESKKDTSIFEMTFAEVREEFSKLHLEEKVTLFEPKILVKVKEAYQHYNMFSQRVLTTLIQYNTNKGFDLKTEIDKLHPEYVREDIIDAMQLIKETYEIEEEMPLEAENTLNVIDIPVRRDAIRF